MGLVGADEKTDCGKEGNMSREAMQRIDDLVESARLLGRTQEAKSFGVYTQENARFERAMYESIEKHKAALRAAPDVQTITNDALERAAKMIESQYGAWNDTAQEIAASIRAMKK